MKKIKDEVVKLVDSSRLGASTITDEQRLNKFLELKIYNILCNIKLNVGGNARFFRIVKKI